MIYSSFTNIQNMLINRTMSWAAAKLRDKMYINTRAHTRAHKVSSWHISEAWLRENGISNKVALSRAVTELEMRLVSCQRASRQPNRRHRTCVRGFIYSELRIQFIALPHITALHHLLWSALWFLLSSTSGLLNIQRVLPPNIHPKKKKKKQKPTDLLERQKEGTNFLPPRCPPARSAGEPLGPDAKATEGAPEAASPRIYSSSTRKITGARLVPEAPSTSRDSAPARTNKQTNKKGTKKILKDFTRLPHCGAQTQKKHIKTGGRGSLLPGWGGAKWPSWANCSGGSVLSVSRAANGSSCAAWAFCASCAFRSHTSGLERLDSTWGGKRRSGRGVFWVTRDDCGLR